MSILKPNRSCFRGKIEIMNVEPQEIKFEKKKRDLIQILSVFQIENISAMKLYFQDFTDISIRSFKMNI